MSEWNGRWCKPRASASGSSSIGWSKAGCSRNFHAAFISRRRTMRTPPSKRHMAGVRSCWKFPEGELMAKYSFTVDGKRVSVDAQPEMPLLYALRDDLGLNNPHFGCGLAQCGACTVHLNGEAVRSCVMP